MSDIGPHQDAILTHVVPHLLAMRADLSEVKAGQTATNTTVGALAITQATHDKRLDMIEQEKAVTKGRLTLVMAPIAASIGAASHWFVGRITDFFSGQS